MTDKLPFLCFHEPISSITHLLSACFFLYFGVKMIIGSRGNGNRMAALILYVFCGVFLYSMSGVYHLLEKGTTSNYVLQILDHSGIYLMISGSFTPFQVILLRGLKRWIPLITIWVLAITGLTLTSVFFDTMPEWLLLSFFISMGWMSLFSLWFMRKVHLRTIKLIFIGGMLYTLGAIFDFLKGPNLIPRVFESHELFHVFVSAASYVHFKGIYEISKMPITNKLTAVITRTPNRLSARFLSERGIFVANNEEQLRLRIKNWIKRNYLKALMPTKVRLVYKEEDDIDISSGNHIKNSERNSEKSF